MLNAKCTCGARPYLFSLVSDFARPPTDAKPPDALSLRALSRCASCHALRCSLQLRAILRRPTPCKMSCTSSRLSSPLVSAVSLASTKSSPQHGHRFVHLVVLLPCSSRLPIKASWLSTLYCVGCTHHVSVVDGLGACFPPLIIIFVTSGISAIPGAITQTLALARAIPLVFPQSLVRYCVSFRSRSAHENEPSTSLRPAVTVGGNR